MAKANSFPLSNSQQPGPDDPNLSPSFGDGPGDLRIERERRTLPSGREIEFVVEQQIRYSKDGQEKDVSVLQYPMTDCTCVPLNITDIYECEIPRCQRIVCGRQIFTCQPQAYLQHPEMQPVIDRIERQLH